MADLKCDWDGSDGVCSAGMTFEADDNCPALREDPTGIINEDKKDICLCKIAVRSRKLEAVLEAAREYKKWNETNPGLPCPDCDPEDPKPLDYGVPEAPQNDFCVTEDCLRGKKIVDALQSAIKSCEEE